MEHSSYIEKLKFQFEQFSALSKPTTHHIGLGGSNIGNQAQYHLTPEVFFQVKGFNKITCPETVFKLKPLEIAIIPERTAHIENHICLDDSFEMIVLMFQSDYQFSLHTMHIKKEIQSIHPITYFQSDNTRFILQSLKEIERIQTEKTRSSIIPPLLQVVITHLKESLNNPIPSKNGKFSGFAQNIIDYIDQNISLPELSVRLISKQFHYSTDHINRLFKAEVRQNLSSFILNRKLTLAKKLLETESANYNISEIAWSCGFSNISYFNRQFKRKFFTTPKEINKNHPQSRP